MWRNNLKKKFSQETTILRIKINTEEISSDTTGKQNHKTNKNRYEPTQKKKKKKDNKHTGVIAAFEEKDAQEIRGAVLEDIESRGNAFVVETTSAPSGSLFAEGRLASTLPLQLEGSDLLPFGDQSFTQPSCRTHKVR